MPLVSIVVPVYNVKKYLAKCVDSILAQTLGDYECILVDDGSTDGSADICEKVAMSDGRIKVIHKANGGLSDARNVGLDNASGKYVCFVDSDDTIANNMLESLYGRIRKDNLDIAVGDVMCNDLSTGERYHSGPLKSFCNSADVCTWSDCPNILDAMFNVAAGNKMYRRELFTKRRFEKGIKFEDVPMWTNLLFSNARIGCVNEIVYNYNINRPGSIVTVGDYRGYPNVWGVQTQALKDNGLWRSLGSDFASRITMKAIQAYGHSSRVTKHEFYKRVQSVFRSFGKNIALGTEHNLGVEAVSFIHYWVWRHFPLAVYKTVFCVDAVIFNPKVNSLLKRKLQRH